MKKRYYLIPVLLLLLSFSCQPLNRAAIKNRKAQVADSRGKARRAVNLLVTAARLDPNKQPQYYTQAAGILFEQGKFNAAYRLLDKIPPCEGTINCSKMELAEAKAWKGTIALQMGQRCAAENANYSAWRILERYDLENDSLRSVVRNNQAVSRIFCQGAYSESGDNQIHFKLIHRRDFQMAHDFLDEALVYDPNNCTAAYNKLLIEAILSVSPEHWNYGYLPDSLYPQLGLPYYDCLTSEEEEEETSFSFNTLTKELAKAQEIVLVLDISGSMSTSVVSGDGATQMVSRVQLMKAACDSLLSNLDPQQTKVGAITIGGSCGAYPLLQEAVGDLDHLELNTLIQSLPLNGATPLDERVLTGIDLFTRKKKTKKVMFLFSDGIGGCTSYRRNICGLSDELAKHNIQFSVFSLLLESRAGREYGLLNCIVDNTAGMLLGLDEKGETTDKTIQIDRMAASIPIFMDEVIAGESQPYLGTEDLRIKADSLQTR